MRQLISIQVLRAIAAIAVALMHIRGEFSGQLHVALGIGWAKLGAAGVDLFFVISGFVMAYTTRALFAAPGGPRIFLSRRIARIVPLYWVTTAIFVVCLSVDVGAPIIERFASPQLVCSFLFVPCRANQPPINPLGWTLNYEAFFYAVFAGALVLPRRVALTAIVVLFTAMVAIGRAFSLPHPFAFWFDPLILEFCFGMLIAAAYSSGVRVSRRSAHVLVLAAIVAYVAPMPWIEDWIAWRAVVWGVPSALLVAAATLTPEKAPASLPTRAIAFLGDASYSLYLTHLLVLLAMRPLLLPAASALGVWAWGFVLASASVATAVVCYLAFEKPVTRLARRVLEPARDLRSEELVPSPRSPG